MDPVDVSALCRLTPRRIQVLGRDVDLRGLANAGVEQHMVDRADPTADIEQRCRGYPSDHFRDLAQQPSRASDGPAASELPELTFRDPGPKLALDAFARAAGDRHADYPLPIFAIMSLCICISFIRRA